MLLTSHKSACARLTSCQNCSQTPVLHGTVQGNSRQRDAIVCCDAPEPAQLDLSIDARTYAPAAASMPDSTDGGSSSSRHTQVPGHAPNSGVHSPSAGPGVRLYAVMYGIQTIACVCLVSMGGLPGNATHADASAVLVYICCCS
jgi:hypothetical protein